MATLLLISICLGIGVFLGMVLCAAFSTGRVDGRSCPHCDQYPEHLDELT